MSFPIVCIYGMLYSSRAQIISAKSIKDLLNKLSNYSLYKNTYRIKLTIKFITKYKTF